MPEKLSIDAKIELLVARPAHLYLPRRFSNSFVMISFRYRHRQRRHVLQFNKHLKRVMLEEQKQTASSSQSQQTKAIALDHTFFYLPNLARERFEETDINKTTEKLLS